MQLPNHIHSVERIVYGVTLATAFLVCVSLIVLLQSKQQFTRSVASEISTATTSSPTPFPVSVIPQERLIKEDAAVDDFLQNYLTYETSRQRYDRWSDRLFATFSQFDWYQQLASPSTRIIVILPGERQEQITHNLSRILRWNSDEAAVFVDLVTAQLPNLPDGTFFPGRYIVPHDASPYYIASLLNDQFRQAVRLRYTEDIEAVVPLRDTLIIASLLEREAYDFTDMRYISGIIWNRLFIDMNLQLDASLQYAKANIQPGNWWPPARPADKFIDSPFNTYQNPGLPPSPIANPSLASIIAALNPRPTDCLFYFHDRRAGFHCSETYEQHVRGLRVHYGQGR